ncbi:MULTISPECIES: phage tail protein [unclassified Variovorax]|uniref:phage tail protein n=1 Tax=unclassified Variovorax TaxID=663243 RepID=UPI0013923CC8|nr:MULTISPECIES: phage tail protein [unclassified Variovorax]
MQSVLGVVGGVIGSFFGVPQLGFIAGSLVGGLLTEGEKTEGPRLDSLKVQVSTYGAGIPVLYGTERIGGNVVWSTDKLEFESTTDVGKGGGAEHTDYRYFVQMRIALCETPRDGSTVSLVQIFQDGKLKWDARSGLPISTALASEENLFAFFTLYQGHSDQLPDAIEEIYAGGAGSVPAYRGVVSIAMRAIECPGGRVPQFSFVLSTSSATVIEVNELADAPAGVTSYHGQYIKGGIWHTNNTDADTDGNGELEVYFSHSGAPMTLERTIPLLFCKVGFRTTFAPIPCPGTPNPTVIRTRTDANEMDTYIDIIDLNEGTQTAIFTYTKGTLDYPFLSSSYATAAHDPQTGKYVMVGGGTTDLQTKPAVINQDGTMTTCDVVTGTTVGPVGIYEDAVYVVTVAGGSLQMETRNATTGAVLAAPVVGPALGVSDVFAQAAIFCSSQGVFVSVPTTNGVASRFFRVTDSAWELIYTADILQHYTGASANFYSDGNMSVVGPSSADRKYEVVRPAVSISDVLVKDIISDQCERVGETRYDVSAIPDEDTIHGYKLQNPASARSNVDPLLTAFAIFVVDEDGLIKFKKYEDIASEATISYDELGQAEDGADPADAMPLSRTQEIDLPRSVSVSYINQDFDYQTATEAATRQVTEANEDLTIELPIATNSDHAARVAQTILFARWRQQNTRAMKVSRKFAFLSPGDGVTVEYPRGTSRLWRIMSLTDTGAVIEMTVEPGDAELFTQTAIGAAGYIRQGVDPLPAPTALEILDGPILQDSDNNAGLYAVMESRGTGWTGAELLMGDSVTSLEPVGTVSNESVIGSAETALGDFTRNVVDEVNLLTVNIGEGSLSNITRDVLLAGTSNVAAVGGNGRWEIIKFQRADSLGSGRYILSGLLRGLRGTGWAAGLHQVADRFILLGTAGTLRPNLDPGAIGQTKIYKARSKGRSAESAFTRSYANTAEGLKPFSPVDLRKSISSNNITLTWGRRSRLVDNVLSTGVIPLGESLERYDVVIYSDGTFTTIKRVLSVFSASAVYTSAEQIADFGSNQSTLYVRVYQLSDTIGRGHELQATV